MASYEYTFTVFTPTYNRAHTLGRLYESLSNQTFSDFEWLVVDHGSKDETEELIHLWQEEATFDIRHKIQETIGKHHNYNRGLELARGELFYPVDSDDELLPDALEVLCNHWRAIPEDERSSFAGVAGLCVTPDGEVVGDQFPKDVFDSNHLSNRYIHGIGGEKSGFIRTEVATSFPFPNNEAVVRVPENIVWDDISREYRFRYINEELRVFHDESDENRITKRPPSESAPEMVMYHHHVLSNNLDGYVRHAPWQFYRSGANFTRFGLQADGSLPSRLKRLPVQGLLLSLIGLPLGLLLYVYDRIREHRMA